jgi:hypothetical protein
MAGWVEEKINSVLQFILADMAGTYSDELWRAFAGLFGSPLPILHDPTVSSLRAIAVSIALGALPAVIAWVALKQTLETMDGSSVTPPAVLIRRCLTAGVTVTAISLVAWYGGTFADYLRDVLGAYGLGISFLELLFKVFHGDLTLILLTLVFLLGVGAVILQRAVLGMEFTLLLIIGAFLGLTRVTDDNPLPWQVWKREMFAICLTPLLQLLILLLFARRLAGVDAASFGRWLDSFALLYLLWHMPRWTRQFTYFTGIGGTVGGLGLEVGRIALMRHLIRSAAKGG